MCLASCLAATATTGEAATLYWATGTSGWSTNTNWSTQQSSVANPASPPTNADTVVFSMSTLNSANSDALMSTTNPDARHVTFDSSGTTRIVKNSSATTLTLGASGVPATITLNAGAGPAFISGTARVYLVSSGTIINNSSSRLTITGTVTPASSSKSGASGTLFLAGSGTGGVTFSGPIEDNTGSSYTMSVDINMAPTARVLLDNNNAYTGSTTLTQGIVDLGVSTDVLGRGSLTVYGGALASAQSARTVSNNVTLRSSTTSPLTLGGNGIAVTLSGGINFFGGNSRAIVLTDNATFSGDYTNGGFILDVTSAARRLTLTGSGNYAGPVQVRGGVLNVQNKDALGTTAGATTVSSGATLELQGAITTAAEPLTLSGTGFNASEGALHNVSGNNTFAGLVTLAASTRITSATNTVTLSNAGTITGSGFDLTVEGAGNTTITSIIGTGAGGLVKGGAGTLTLNGANTYTGATTVNAGIMALGASNRLSDSTAVTVAGGGLNMSSFTDTVSSLSITSGSVYGSGTLTATTYGLGGGTVAANLGSGTLAVTANSTLTGAAAATTVNVNAGTLTLSSGGRLTGSPAVSGSAGATLALGGNETIDSLSGAAGVSLGGNTLTIGGLNSSTTYSGSLSGVGALVKAGSGTFTFTGAVPDGVSTTVSAGRFIANGTLGTGSLSVAAAAWLTGTGAIGGPVAVNGTLSPGSSPGLLSLGSLTLGGTSTTLMEIAGTSRGSLYDGIDITDGGIAYGGTLSLDFQQTFADQASFLLFGITTGTGSRTGSFAGVTATGAYGSLTFSNLGSGVWSSGTIAGVNQELQFNEATGLATVVPEPASFALAFGAAVGVAGMYRRRRPDEMHQPAA